MQQFYTDAFSVISKTEKVITSSKDFNEKSYAYCERAEKYYDVLLAWLTTRELPKGISDYQLLQIIKVSVMDAVRFSRLALERSLMPPIRIFYLADVSARTLSIIFNAVNVGGGEVEGGEKILEGVVEFRNTVFEVACIREQLILN